MEISALLLVLLTTFAIRRGQCEESDDCAYSSYDPRGTYESPGYPDGYPPGSDCMYRLFTNTHLNLNFEHFAIEDNGDCSSDYLQIIFDATSQNPKQRRYCGDGLHKIEGGKLRGKGPAILIFRSNEVDNMAGFKFSFEQEMVGPDPCNSNPCQNGGTCSRMVGYYQCDCVEGFRGKSCEIDWDDCAPQPCKNGGLCQDGPNSFTCECIHNYTGDACEIEPDPCESTPCMNGGLCSNQIPYFICECPKSFSGELCEEPVPTIPPPPTTPAPTTTTTTTEVMTTTAPEIEDSNAGGTGDVLDVKDVDDNSGDSSGAIVAALIICMLLIALAAFLLWYWSRYQGDASNGFGNDLRLSEMKSKIQRAFNKQRWPFKSSKPKARPGKDSWNTNRPIPRDLIVEEIDSEDERRRRRKAKANRKPNNPVKDTRPPRNRNVDDDTFGGEFDFADQNTMPQKKIDLSPEEAVAVLNQLLGHEREKDDINIKNVLENNRDGKQKAKAPKDIVTYQKSLPGSVSAGEDDEYTTKKQYKRNRRLRNATKLNYDNDEDRDVGRRQRIRRTASSAELTLKLSSVKYEKTQDPADKVQDWLTSSKPKKTKGSPTSVNSISTIDSTLSQSQSSRSSSATSTKKTSPVKGDISVEEYDYNDEDSTIIPSPDLENPRHQKPREMQILPVTKNKAKSLVDKLVKAPIRSKQNFVGPRLGVKRENAFLDWYVIVQ